jgi:hypothetical protein
MRSGIIESPACGQRQVIDESVGFVKNKNVGLVGFICPKNRHKVKFQHCSQVCQDPCYPLPILLALISNRNVTPNRYSVTELLNPARIAYLSRNYPFYETPESLVWRTFGTAWHELLQRAIEDAPIKEFGMFPAPGYIMEESFSVEVDDSILSGRPDCYDARRQTLWDFKTMSVWGVKDIKKSWDGSTYHWQLNMYKTYGYPRAESLKIAALIKDWSPRYLKEGIHPIEIIPVPILATEMVQRRTSAALAAIKAAEMSPESVARCTQEETWDGKRCKSYCPVVKLCRQMYCRIDFKRDKNGKTDRHIKTAKEPVEVVQEN